MISSPQCISPLSQSPQSSLDTLSGVHEVKFIPVNEEDVQRTKYILTKAESTKHSHVQPINIAQHIKYGITLFLCSNMLLHQQKYYLIRKLLNLNA